MPEPAPSRPRVRVVVVNWNSHWFTRRCLDALLATDADASVELVVVDNASVDGSLERLQAALPQVTYIRNDRNLGFAEGCNRAMQDLDGVDHVALVNNDAVPEPGWLTPLLEAADGAGDIGAVAATLVLEPTFCRVRLSVDGDATIDQVLVDGVDALARTRFDGVDTVGRTEWPMELVHHLHGDADALVPMGADDRDVTVVATGRGELRVSTDVDSAAVTLSDRPARVTVAPASERIELLNGLGTDRTAQAEYFDRHFGAPFDPAVLPELAAPGRDVTGFCGGGVLLRADMLRRVGRFDPSYFAYYEDSDLSWRASRDGWRTVTAPRSVIRHSFGGSGGAKAPGFFLLNYRNWLLTVLRNADPAQRRAVLSTVRERVWWAVRANVLSALRRRRRPSLDLLVAWGRTLVSTASARRHQRRQARPPGSTPTDEVVAAFQPAFGPRLPSTRPGGPLLVHLVLDGDGDGPWRGLLTATHDEVEVVPVVSATGRTGLRTASAAEVRAALDPGVGRVRSGVTSGTTLESLSPRSCVARVTRGGVVEVSVLAEGRASAEIVERFEVVARGLEDPSSAAAVLGDVLEGYRRSCR